MKPGHDRIRGVLDVLANPQDGYPIIHVAGTNGKTSTARFVAGLLRAHGLTPGLFTSPHLQRIEERYEVGGEIITAEEFTDAVADIRPFVEVFEERSGDTVTYFELTTALAFAWFAERAVDVAVIETGLGGRLDATNVVDAEVAVLTSVGVEHTQYLGDTIEEIAGEKLAILSEGQTLVTGPVPAEVETLAMQRVAEADARWLRSGVDVSATEVIQAHGGWVADVEGAHAIYEEVVLHVHGRHQVDNFVTAVAAVEALFGRSLDLGAVREAASTTRLPGRMEVVAHDPPLMLDGAHNPQGVATLAAALAREFPSLRWEVVFGAMEDKDVAGMLEGLEGWAVAIHTAAADGADRAMSADELARLATNTLGIPATPQASVADALGAARSSGRPVLVTGSLYVVGEVRELLDLRSEG